MKIVNLSSSCEKVRVYSVMPSGRVVGGERIIPKNQAQRFVRNARASIINVLSNNSDLSRTCCSRYMQNVKWVMVGYRDGVVKVINHFAKL